MAYTTQPNVDDYVLTIVCLKRTKQLLGSILMSSSPKVNILRIQKPFISIMSYDVFDLLTQEARLYPIRKPRKEGAAENKSRSRHFCSDWRELSKRFSVGIAEPLAETTCYISLRLFIFRRTEYLRGIAVLDQITE